MNFLNNMRIGRKLAMAFAMLITISVIVSAMTYERLSFIQEANRMQVHTYNVLDQVDLAVAGMVDQETGFRAYLLAGEDKFLEPYRKGRVAFEAAVSRAKQLTSDNPAQQVRLTELQRLGDQWRTEVAEKAIAMMAKPETREAARQIEISGAGKQFMDGLRAKAAEIAAIEQGLMVQRSAALDEAFATEYAVAIIGGVLSFSLATLFALLLSRTIAAPTARMTAVMLELAKGNKSIEVPDRDRKDEIGEMAQTVEVFKRNAIEAERLAAAQAAEEAAKAERTKRLEALMANFDAKVRQVLGAFGTASGDMGRASTAMASAAEQTKGQSVVVASAAGQATANVQTVAAAAEELAGSIGEIGRQVQQSTAIASQAVAGADSANRIVGGLAEAVNRISEVVNLINDIASQTNLLALNATIEAARAGEAGKGFAVVASEVKSLANQTAKATEEIAGQIGAVQGSTGEAVKAIAEIGRIIAQINEISSAIAAAVEEQSAATSEITRNVQQAATGTQQVSDNIRSVNQAADESGQLAGRVKSVAETLNRHSDELRHEIEGFLAGVKAA